MKSSDRQEEPSEGKSSRSLLDPVFAPLVPKIHHTLHLPARLRPEWIVCIGHLIAALGGVSLGLSFRHPAWAILAAACVAANHFADLLDGYHARATDQCRRGGELLDHLVDPVAMSYWVAGIATSCNRLDWGLAGVVVVFTASMVTALRARIVGDWVHPSIGVTEVRFLIVIYALIQSFVASPEFAIWFMIIVIIGGRGLLVLGVGAAVREANAMESQSGTDRREVEKE